MVLSTSKNSQIFLVRWSWSRGAPAGFHMAMSFCRHSNDHDLMLSNITKSLFPTFLHDRYDPFGRCQGRQRWQETWDSVQILFADLGGCHNLSSLRPDFARCFSNGQRRANRLASRLASIIKPMGEVPAQIFPAAKNFVQAWAKVASIKSLIVINDLEVGGLKSTQIFYLITMWTRGRESS